MKRPVLILLVLVFMCTALVLQHAAYAEGPTPENQIMLDITVGDAGEMSVGGIGMTQMGLRKIDDQTKNLLKSLNSAHLVVQGQQVTLDVQGTPLLKGEWNPAGLRVIASLATQRDVQISPELQARFEEWVKSSNLDISVRYTNEPSKPFVAKLSKPLLVQLGPEGQVTVEKIPLEYRLDPEMTQMLKRSQVQNTILCWNKGTLTINADGRDLPSITLTTAGAQHLTRALNLKIESGTEPLWGALLGVDVTLPGATPVASINCGS